MPNGRIAIGPGASTGTGTYNRVVNKGNGGQNGTVPGSSILACTGSGESLPVELIAFQAKPFGKTVQLSWQTAWERNADAYVVERSADLGEFLAVGRIAAKGTTDLRQFYQLVDERPLPGTGYYRLKQVDTDGTVAYSKPIAVILTDEQPALLIFQSAAGELRLRTAHLDVQRVRLTGLNGQAISTGLTRRAEGEWSVSTGVPLRRGLYVLTAESVTGQLLRAKFLAD